VEPKQYYHTEIMRRLLYILLLFSVCGYSQVTKLNNNNFEIGVSYIDCDTIIQNGAYTIKGKLTLLAGDSIRLAKNVIGRLALIQADGYDYSANIIQFLTAGDQPLFISAGANVVNGIVPGTIRVYNEDIDGQYVIIIKNNETATMIFLMVLEFYKE
jgi:hypothetical protein